MTSDTQKPKTYNCDLARLPATLRPLTELRHWELRNGNWERQQRTIGPTLGELLAADAQSERLTVNHDSDNGARHD
jgi:hypothetical protein